MSDYVDAEKDPTVGDWIKAGYPGIVSKELGPVPEVVEEGTSEAPVAETPLDLNP